MKEVNFSQGVKYWHLILGGINERSVLSLFFQGGLRPAGAVLLGESADC